MSGYRNYEDEELTPDIPDSQGYNPSEYNNQAYEENNYYNPDNIPMGGNTEYYTPDSTTWNGDNHYYNPDDAASNGNNTYYAADAAPGDASYGTSEYTDYDYSQQRYDNSGYDNRFFGNPESMDSNYNSQEYADTGYTDTAYNTYSERPNGINESLTTSLYAEDYAEPEETTPDTVSPDYEKEPLSEAEIADIKRQKAATRRRKIAARERRRKKRRQQAIIRCSILLAIVILIIVVLVKLVTGIQEHFEKEEKAKELEKQLATIEATTAEPVADIDEAIIAQEIPADRTAAMDILTQQAEADAEIQGICDNAAALPDIMLRHLAANSELKEFAIKYPAKINIVFDGNFTMDVTSGEVPLYLQFDERWGYADYANDLVGLSGAGPTSLSMVYTYLKNAGDMNPIKIADYATEAGYLNQDGNTHWSLMTDGAASLGLVSEEINVDKDVMTKALADGKLIICQMSSGDFTTSQSYIVIRDYRDGFFYVNDPTSAARSEVGWDYKRLSTQIDKMCTFTAGADNTRDNNTQPDDNQTGDSTGDDGQTGDAAGDDGQTGANSDNNE